MKAHRAIDSLAWAPHPTAVGVRIKPMITSKEHGLGVTCMLVEVPKGNEVPEHVHENQDDILYPLKGGATMWVEGDGEFALKQGVIVRVPKGVRHKIVDVKEDLLIYDVFCPALL